MRARSEGAAGRSAGGVTIVALLLWITASTALAQVTLPPDPGQTVGRRVPEVVLHGDDGRPFPLADLAGRPVIVSPIFTRCRHACPMITASLERVVAELGTPGIDFEVLSVSFDARDAAADLRRFRESRSLPPGWRVAGLPDSDRMTFFDALAFRFVATQDGGFLHPNLVVVLTPSLEVADYVFGTDLDPDALRGALSAARGRRPLARTLAPAVFVVSLLGILATSFVLIVVWQRARRRATGSVNPTYL